MTLIPEAFIQKMAEVDKWGNSVSLIHVCDRKYPYRMVHFKADYKRHQHYRVYGGRGAYLDINEHRHHKASFIDDLEFAGLTIQWKANVLIPTIYPDWFNQLSDVRQNNIKYLATQKDIDNLICQLVLAANESFLWTTKDKFSDA